MQSLQLSTVKPRIKPTGLESKNRSFLDCTVGDKRHTTSQPEGNHHAEAVTVLTYRTWMSSKRSYSLNHKLRVSFRLHDLKWTWPLPPESLLSTGARWGYGRDKKHLGEWNLQRTEVTRFVEEGDSPFLYTQSSHVETRLLDWITVKRTDGIYPAYMCCRCIPYTYTVYYLGICTVYVHIPCT